MFVHSVYFWLRPDLDPADRASFVEGLHSLATIDTVSSAFIGPPAATDRPIIDRSYSFALILVFADKAAHDAYQVDPVHDAFRNTCAAFWSDLKIYDCQTTL